ncbi:Hnt2 dinucleoside triphosphate hydrolase [Candida orthopsilosis Co 90-125]|uniref:Bis(5'-adenosyl)-triphosphatase n=1 Tax=Candida orthopsilosis (strain 90-125) TaxID=1136231 RepID=H8X410_CANO9|nr:Hnt2 dinucleoside triphosphate hydrolase [Candida orthopsilosis Co 90-125]CCG25798.1 Hnt2 dinucleoside triphosphate hydrolase [Candida orthopsilosis Co 90-125]
MTTPMTANDIYFFKYLVNNQVFYRTKFTYALVNLKPLVPGHVLVVPLRTAVLRLGDLTPDESIDYMNTLQLIQKFITKTYKADSLNIAIQDGPEAGQSVPHLHTHIIPRYMTDGYGDSIYSKLESEDLEAEYKRFEVRKRQYLDHLKVDKSELAQNDADRKERTPTTMQEEATWLNNEIQKFIAHLKT